MLSTRVVLHLMEEWDAFLDAYNQVVKKREEIADFIIEHIEDPQYIVDNIKEILDGTSISDSIIRTQAEPKCEEGVGAVR